MEEIWKEVVDYEGLYEVSSFGVVKSTEAFFNHYYGKRRRRGKIKSQMHNDTGYKIVNLFKENKVKVCKVHRLVALAFLPNPENKRCVNHKDGNKQNNNLSNLEWATHSENIIHAFATGLNISNKGEEIHFAKLTALQVLEIRRLKASGIKGRVLAMQFEMHENSISRIIQRRVWAHI